MLRSYLLVSEGPPLLRHIKGQRIFDRVLVTLSWRLARWLESVLGTRRLAAAAAAARLRRAACRRWRRCYARGIATEGSAPAGFDFVFGMIWAVGIACALAAAYQAKFHRLAALILLGGAGLVTCVSFVWLSAPDLALTQLVVETVTTVLLLLGLRWLPKRVQEFAPAGATASTIRWYRVRDFAIAVACRIGVGGARLRRHDAPAAGEHRGLLCRERLYAGRRHQHRERHPGRLPRVRHVRRDHGARHRRNHCLCVAAAVPPGCRKHSGPGATAGARQLRRDASRPSERTTRSRARWRSRR